MTDPNVIEAIRKLTQAVDLLSRGGAGDDVKAHKLAHKVFNLLAAAEKPAEQTDGPIGIALGGALMFPPGGAEKPAEVAPVAPLPWNVRDTLTKHVFAHCPTREAADRIREWIGASRCEVVEVAAAPTVAAVVPVKFDAACRAMLPDGRTADRKTHGWSATHWPTDGQLAVYLDLSPGEDAGETVAKMLAACGRSA